MTEQDVCHSCGYWKRDCYCDTEELASFNSDEVDLE